jgi:Zn-dependent oligopeptidase
MIRMRHSLGMPAKRVVTLLCVCVTSRTAFAHLAPLASSCFSTSPEHTNPLLRPGTMPAYRSVKPEHVKPAVEQLLASLSSDFAQLEKDLSSANGGHTYATVVERMEHMQDPIGYAWGLVSHLQSVQDTTEMREQKDAVQPAVVQTMTKLGQSRGV